MSKNLLFIKTHKTLWILFAVLFVCVSVMGGLLIWKSASRPPDDTATDDPGIITQTVEVTTVETESETEAVIELPPPFFDAVSDTVFYPSSHDGDSFEAVSRISDDYRIYAVYPDTDSANFNGSAVVVSATTLPSASVMM